MDQEKGQGSVSKTQYYSSVPCFGRHMDATVLYVWLPDKTRIRNSHKTRDVDLIGNCKLSKKCIDTEGDKSYKGQHNKMEMLMISPNLGHYDPNIRPRSKTGWLIQVWGGLSLATCA